MNSSVALTSSAVSFSFSSISWPIWKPIALYTGLPSGAACRVALVQSMLRR